MHSDFDNVESVIVNDTDNNPDFIRLVAAKDTFPGFANQEILGAGLPRRRSRLSARTYLAQSLSLLS